MSIINFKEKILPHIIACFLFFLIFSVYFSPLYSGKKTRQGDSTASIGATKEVQDYREKGEYVFWTNTVFSGMPTLMMGLYHSGDIINTYTNHFMRIAPQTISIFTFGAIAIYFLLLAFKVPKAFAFLGGVGYTFCTFQFVSIDAGHYSKVFTTFIIPIVLIGIITIFQKRYILGTILAAFGTTILIHAGHYQIIYYSLFGMIPIGMYYTYVDLKEKNNVDLLKKIGVLIFAAILGVGANTVKLVSDFSYIKYSTRGDKVISDNREGSTQSSAMDYDYAFSWSQGILESATLIIPYYYGGSSSEDIGVKSNVYKEVKSKTGDRAQAKSISQNAPLYWGDQPFTSGPVYYGAIFFFLFILSIYSWKNKLNYILIGCFAFLLLIAWGKNLSMLNYFLFDHFPGMNKFRAVAMALGPAQLFFLLSGCIGFNYFLTIEDKNLKNKILLKSAVTTVGIIVILIIIGLNQSFNGAVDAQLAQWPDWLKDALNEDRKSLLLSDGFRSILFIVVAAVVIFAILIQKLEKKTGLYIIILLSLIDLFSVNKRYISNDMFKKSNVREKLFTKTEADKLILEDQSYYRVFNQNGNPFNENNTSYYHNSIGGYRPNKLQRYQDIIDHCISKGNINVINMLNTKYIIRGPERKDVVKNPNSLGNAWLVKNIQYVNNSNEEIDYLKNKEWNPSTTAIINSDEFKLSKNNYNNEGEIKLSKYYPDELEYEVKATEKSFAVFSEVFYNEGWNVTIDDKPVDYVRANYILRGLEIPKGNHKIIFKFKPDWYDTANTSSLIFSLLILVLIVLQIIISLKKNLKGSNEE